MKTGIELITEERQKQIDKHGFTAEHHALNTEKWYNKQQLLSAAIRLVDYEEDGVTSIYKKLVPENWDKGWWERLCEKPVKERLIIAGALIAAELDRLNYIEENNISGRV